MFPASNGDVNFVEPCRKEDRVLGTNKKRYVVGPKGNGKTLILLRKAIDERDKGASVCIPSDPSRPVDRLDAAEHLGQRFFHKTGGDSARGSELILDQYLCEIEPLLAPLDFDASEFFRDFVPKDVMTAEEAWSCEEYYRDWKGLRQDAPAGQPLALLYHLGLLGVSDSCNRASGPIPRFRLPQVSI